MNDKPIEQAKTQQEFYDELRNGVIEEVAVATTVKYIKEVLRARTIHEVIANELREAHLRKLEAETAAEYANAAIQYNEQRIARLMARLTEHTEEGDYT